jgi:hypothetical protein
MRAGELSGGAGSPGGWSCSLLIALLLPVTAWWCAAAERELVRDAHFQGGFQLLEVKPGKRVVYGQLSGRPGSGHGGAAWDLAQWSSRMPLAAQEPVRGQGFLMASNEAKQVVVGVPGTVWADLSLGVNAGKEYPRPRASTAEPWVHLLVQQDFVDPPRLGNLQRCFVSLDARLKRSILVTTNAYSPSLHAAQFLVYLTLANRNPAAPGYGECFWFGIPVFDNRYPMVPAYEAQDFGDTKLFIFTPGTKEFCSESLQGGQWVRFRRDLLPLMREGFAHGQVKGFFKPSSKWEDFRPLGIFIGWEVPGVFDVDLQIRDLSLLVGGSAL